MISEENKLISLRPGSGLDSGIMPAVLSTAGAIWASGRNVWFQKDRIEHAPGSTLLVPATNRKSRAIAQSFVNKPRFYYENFGVVSYYEDAVSTLIGQLDTTGAYDLVPYGTWLLATDNKTQIKLWKGINTFADIETTEFARAKLIKKLGQHILAFSTDVLPSGFHWSDASDVEEWEPTQFNAAGNLPIRDLDSEFMAVVDLGAALAAYSREYMIVVRYVGIPYIFGTPDQALSGIGAVSRNSVVSLGRSNWGLCRGGIFVTDGSSFTYVDRPAVGSWLQENINWARADEIAGHYDEQLGLVVWAVPVMEHDEIAEIGVNPETKAFTYLGTDLGVGVERGVFDYPIVATSKGIVFRSVVGTVAGDFSLLSHRLNATKEGVHKSWGHLLCDGTFGSDAKVRFGFSNSPNEAIDWYPWVPLAFSVPFTPRESLYISLEFKATTALRITGLTVYGTMGAPL